MLSQKDSKPAFISGQPASPASRGVGHCVQCSGFGTPKMVCQRLFKRCFCLKLSLACRLVLLGFSVISVVVLVSVNHSAFQYQLRKRYLHQSLMEVMDEGGDNTGAVQSVSAILPQVTQRLTDSSSGKISSTSAVQQQLSAKDVEKFKLAVSGGELDTLVAVVDAFAAAMKQANVSFFLYSGSLVGSWRHHGLVPWDDDVDFVFPASLRPVAEQALKNLAPTFQLSTTQKVRWKVFHQHSPKIKGRSSVDWSWPFLDISFYQENSTHIWDLDYQHFPKFTYMKSDVFPLTHRPFQGRLLPAPRNTYAFLTQTYNLDLCRATEYNHRKETYISWEKFAEVKCGQLRHVFPFVVRSSSPWTDGGCSETLEKNGTILSCCFVDYISKQC